MEKKLAEHLIDIEQSSKTGTLHTIGIIPINNEIITVNHG